MYPVYSIGYGPIGTIDMLEYDLITERNGIFFIQTKVLHLLDGFLFLSCVLDFVEDAASRSLRLYLMEVVLFKLRSEVHEKLSS